MYIFFVLAASIPIPSFHLHCELCGMLNVNKPSFICFSFPLIAMSNEILCLSLSLFSFFKSPRCTFTSSPALSLFLFSFIFPVRSWKKPIKSWMGSSLFSLSYSVFSFGGSSAFFMIAEDEKKFFFSICFSWENTTNCSIIHGDVQQLCSRRAKKRE